MRAEMAAHGARKGPAGVLLAAIVSFLEMLVALLAEFKAGRLAVAQPGHGAPNTPCAAAPNCAGAAVRGAGLPALHPGPVPTQAPSAKPRAGARRRQIAPRSVFAAGGSVQATGLFSAHAGRRLQGREIGGMLLRLAGATGSGSKIGGLAAGWSCGHIITISK
jgi:hypothetical protein